MKKRDQKTKRRAVTLIEMIVVMLLIATITGALAYNYNSSLNEGKAFKTKEGISRIKTILSMAMVENPEKQPEEIVNEWQGYVRSSPLAGKADDLLKDGWGKPYNVRIGGDNGSQEVEVSSEAYDAFQAKKRQGR
jgi:prepilin-type N-terminal cleavage/methylation domain-containing protein